MNGYFGQLLDMWGEKKTEYTADSFFGVFISFYDEFVTELKKREAQEKMARSIQEHAMDNFQKDIAGKASNAVGERRERKR